MKNSLVFTGILALLLVALDFLLLEGQKNYPALANIKLKKVIEEKSLNSEIVIFGSSVAEGGIDPAILSTATSMKCVNLALSGRRIQDWQPLAYNYLEYADSTKIVIIDIFPNAFNFPHSIYHPHDYYPYLANRYVKKSLATINPEFAKMSQIPLYYLTQLNSTIVENAIKYWRLKIHKNSISHHLPNQGFKKIEEAFTQDLSTPTPVELDKRSIKAFSNLISYCETKGTRVILLGMPVFKKGRSFYAKVDRVYKIADELAKNHENSEYLDFYSTLSLNSNKYFFHNYTHLNYRGAKIISGKLAAYLNSRLRPVEIGVMKSCEQHR